MAPPLGPPPYTQEQISAMTSNEEKLRARAELSSYIVRMKREKQEREANNAQYSSSRSPRGNNFTAGGHSHHTADEFRGGNNYRGHYVPRGRGYRHYHPYGRSQSQRGPYNFQHNSVSFNQAVSLDKLPQSDTSSVGASHALIDTHSEQSSQAQTGLKTLCAALTSTGKCSRPGCPHIHDANKQALCKKWLFKDDCRNGDYCLLSHKPSPNNSPTCLHFQSGLCTKENCRFAHIHLNPAALNCDSFGRLGYCEKGEDCAEFHAYECPTFSNTGSCPLGDKCPLRHVLRADRLRNGGRRSPVETPSKDIKVEDDVHENGHDIIITKREDTQDSHSISQQADFVPFGPED